VVGGRARRHGAVSGGRFSGVHPRMLGGGIAGLGSQLLPRLLGSIGAMFVMIVAVIVMRPAPQSAAKVMRVYATNSRQQAIVVLDEGTRVVLSPNTTLREIAVRPHARTIALEGEAYVSVVHAAEVPFVVQSGGTSTQVLGTEFLIRHRPGDPSVRVAVAVGKVRMTIRARPSSGVTLIAGQIGEARDSTVHVGAVGDLAPGTEWTHDQLVFHDVPLSTILATVSRWYGYQFRYADSTLAQRTVTLGVSTQSPTEALAAIERVLHVNLAVSGNTVTLIPQPLRQIKETPRMRTYDVWTPTREFGR
jgi:ferric-dicitrate binding protein FerR (iron transport regulator)